MRKKLFFLLVFTFVFIPLSPSYASDEQMYIVSFKSEIDEQIIESSGAKIIESLINSPIVIISANESALAKLQNADHIEAIEKNKKITIAAQEVNWGIKPVKIPHAWETGYTGKGVKIAIIDTGVGPHEDLKVAKNVSFVALEPSNTDYNGHGTHIAGIIAALDNHFGVKGVAPNAALYSLKVFNKHGDGYTHDVIKAIDWAIEHEMDMINLSLTSEIHMSSYENIINRAYEKGLLIVGAAGNSTSINIGIDNVKYPARFENVIAVSSVDWDGKKGFYSSVGPAVEVAAPGVRIYSTYAGNSYSYLQGTSMATAFVTGHLALLKEAYPHLSNVQLRKKMIDDVVDLGPKGRDLVFGYGLIQASTYDLPLYEYPATHNPVTELIVSTTNVVGKVNDTIKVNVDARLKNGQKIDVSDFTKWTFEHPEIASSRGGRIDLHQEGETTLQVDYGGLSSQLSITVAPDSNPSTTEGLPFTDIPADFSAKDEIHDIYKKQIIRGYADRTFRPRNPIQRQHVSAIITRTLELEQKVAFKPFLDVSMHSPYYYEIMKTQQANIFSGDANKFHPQKYLTRAQMAKIIVEAFNLPLTESAHPFPDVAKTHWANEYIATLYEAGITIGSDGLYHPESFVTRTQFAVFIHRTLNQFRQ
ncbi:S8 family peptidase [Sporosarcina ureilytica]|uniref:SLH domain-containing protein n=1 Tax=Sporosarcina ureilytica TaxID=298596 RepID=A0A1D8JJ78_9BACL|nr:S8 family serine peptidase [Sporosarcina ureilytica]AOV08763.1 hypothetical protein BI350_15240 [Sporosarcina ureilytica]